MKTKTFSIILALITVLTIFVFVNKYRDFASYDQSNQADITNSEITDRVRIADHEIFVEIADTAELQAKGLAGREYIAKDRGMLFVLTPDTLSTFWMKGMLMPIDIIWINDGKIVQIDSNISPPRLGVPDRQLELFRSKVPVDYVLEVGANISSELGLTTGDLVDLNDANID